MLRVRLELIPYGDEGKAKHLGTMEIGNINSVGNVADYVVLLNKEQVGKVHKFNRSCGAWDLVREAVEVVPPKFRRGLNLESETENLIQFLQEMEKRNQRK